MVVPADDVHQKFLMLDTIEDVDNIGKDHHVCGKLLLLLGELDIISN